MSWKTEWIMENIMGMEGDVTRYSDLVKRNPSNYRTLSEFLSPKTTGMKKDALAKRLGVSVQTLNNWEKEGIPSLEQAVHVAVARKLTLEQTNEFFRKYAGMGELYAADRLHARYIYLLIYRERLEAQWPYEADETVSDWVSRVLNALKQEELRGTKQPTQEPEEAEASRVATEYFMETLLGGDLDAMSELPFRSAGQKAYTYLESYVEGTPFQKNYGNRWIEDLDGEKVRPDRALLNRYYEEEKARYNNLLDKLRTGTTVHRSELIGLSMMLCMTRTQADQLLQLCGKAPISARNLYEGALLLAWSFLDDAVDEAFEAGGSQDMQVLLSQRVEKCLAGLSKGMKKQLREVPGWYLPENARNTRMEKRRLSFILSELTTKMSEIWEESTQENRRIKRCSLKALVDVELEDAGYRPLDKEEDFFLLEQLQRIETLWLVETQKPGKPEKKASRDQMCLKLVGTLDRYYLEIYAPKKKGKANREKRATE